MPLRMILSSQPSSDGGCVPSRTPPPRATTDRTPLRFSQQYPEEPLLSSSQRSSCSMVIQEMEDDEGGSPIELQAQTQTQTQTQTQQLESLTQMDGTQQSQLDLDEEDFSNMTPTPLSPPPVLPWGRLVPVVSSPDHGPVDLCVGVSEYWLGRSSTKCQVPISAGTQPLSKRETTYLAWAHSMISNQHCKIVSLGMNQPHPRQLQHQPQHQPQPQHHRRTSSGAPCQHNQQQQQQESASETSTMLPAGQTPISQPAQILLEDHSGNGTFVNQSTHLRKGHQRILHSGDEICLVNPETLRKRIKSGRALQAILQHYTYIFILTNNKPKQRPCVNPRAMNYHAPTDASSSNSRMAAQQSSPRSARRIEAHYDIREVLGDGTSGQVRRAIHRQTGQDYAVKVISLRRQLDLTSMEHEVSMMQSLDHPYIVQLVDVFVHHGIAMYLVMELVSGGDLFDRIVQQERYTEVEARRVMRRLLSAIFYLHETKNIVHRDLKPENILCAAGHIKLADFGLAKLIESDGLKTFCGTPQYFAPEVLERRHTVAGSGRYGKPADMWSLGVILYILLTGQPPFEADLNPLVAYDALDLFDSDATLWNSMPQAQELVQQMLRLDPKRRLSVRQACDHPWINTDDGDSHVHPLDDPVVTGRKRLFSEVIPEQEDKEDIEKEEPNTVATSVGEAVDDDEDDDDDDNIIASETESVMSKEDFAAAATSHLRHQSVDFVSAMFPTTAGTHGNGSTATSSDNPNGSNTMDTSDAKEVCPVRREMSIDGVEEGTREKDHEKQLEQEELVKVTATTMTTTTTTDDNPDLATSSSSPDGLATTSTMVRELSVTPSECGDLDEQLLLPRSPLTSMNLNDRSNRFREQVLRQQHGSKDDEDHPPSRSSSPLSRRCTDVSQAAVTPNASNVRSPKSETMDDEDEVELEEPEVDPILSQFSSDPSSLDSFPDSPFRTLTAAVPPEASNDHTEKSKAKPTAKKRALPNEEDAASTSSTDPPDAKRRNVRQHRQTKLSAWFGPKKGQAAAAAECK